jgi:hypothetical protein
MRFRKRSSPLELTWSRVEDPLAHISGDLPAPAS